MFRDVIGAIPQIVAGNASIVREELVPFFNFSRQFFSESLSSLTSSEEVRVIYSFWTAWVRHNAILPFAMVLMNTLSAFILFYAFWRVARHFAPARTYAPIVISAAIAFLIHFIILYAKIAHFYTLVIGFAMFALSLSLIIEQLFVKQLRGKKYWLGIGTVSLLVLFNPAIHYHVIFYLVLTVFIMLQLLLGGLISRQKFWPTLGRHMAYFGWIVVFSLIPYALFIFANTGSSMDSVSSQIPVNYWMITYTSVALPFIFSFDIVGHIDLYLHGDYLVPSPRIAAMVILFLCGTVFLYRQWGTLSKQLKVALVALFLTMLIAVWMAMGYANSELVSFHNVLSSLTLFLSSNHIMFSELFEKLVSIFIGILRFPHRFQFIYFYIGGTLLTITLLWLSGSLQRFVKKPVIAVSLVVLLTFIPFLDRDYRAVFASGDASGFLTPYTVPDDLKEIKERLGQRDDDLLFILPTLESGREIVKGSSRFSFLDKYLIYYLEQPTMYYGVGGGTPNKIIAYSAYRAIDREEDWWENVLSQSLNVSHILLPKHLENRPNGLTYMQDIYPKIKRSLEQSTAYKKVVDGSDYILYERERTPDSTRHTFVDMEWNNFLTYFNGKEVAQNRLYFPIQFDTYAQNKGKHYLLTDSPERGFYDLYIGASDTAFHPQTARLPFTEDLVASSNFTNNALSIDTLSIPKHRYNHLHERIPTLTSLLSAQFIGLHAGGSHSVDIPLTPEQAGRYRLVLHAASKRDTLAATIENQTVQLQKVEDDRGKHNDAADFTYYYVDIELPKGQQQLSIQSDNKNAIAVELASLIPHRDMPRSFSDIDTRLLTISPADQDQLYKVRLR